MDGYHNHREHESCSCGNGLSTVHCYECFQFQACCPGCFIESHYHTPFHWAHIWDPERRRFKKVDYASILQLVIPGGAIQLGHRGERCQCPANDAAPVFIITHTNGIHTTKLRTCRCPGAPDKLTQLLQARLFPATTADPRSAFTFAVLKEFHMHSIQSKSAAFDYSLSLRRLTDNILTHSISVSRIPFYHTCMVSSPHLGYI